MISGAATEALFTPFSMLAGIARGVAWVLRGST